MSGDTTHKATARKEVGADLSEIISAMNAGEIAVVSHAESFTRAGRPRAKADPEYSLSGGRKIPGAVWEKLEPLLEMQQDGLLPGISQTYRLRGDRND